MSDNDWQREWLDDDVAASSDRPAGLLLREDDIYQLLGQWALGELGTRRDAAKAIALLAGAPSEDDRADIMQAATGGPDFTVKDWPDDGAPSGGLDVLLDAVRAYGDARADVAYGRATRKAIDLAWDGVLAAGHIPPMDARLTEQANVLVRDIHVEFRDDVDPGEGT